MTPRDPAGTQGSVPVRPARPAEWVTTVDIQRALEARFHPQTLHVRDDSQAHAGHAGAQHGGHYTVDICATAFAGLSRVARHRLVYDALSELMPRGIHALAIQAHPPGEAGPLT